MKKIFNIIIRIILCVLSSLGCTLTFNYNKIVSLLLFFIMLIFSIKGKRDNKRVRIISFIFSLLYSFTYILGDAVYNTGVINTLYYDVSSIVTTIISLIGVTYMIYLINYYIFSLLDNYEMKRKESRVLNKSYIFLYIWLITFLFWIPCFLSYYPGIYSYDITKQVNEIFNRHFTKFHPPIHTGIVAICFFIASKFKVEMVSVYGLLQMVLLSYAITKAIKFLYDKTKNRWVFWLSFVFLVLNPISAIISLIPAKDIYFASFLLLLLPDIYELIYNREKFLSSKFNMVKIIFFFLMAMLFRNNASYVFLIFFIFLLIFEHKDKRIIIISIVPIILFFAVNNVLYPNINVSEGNSREKLSLPMTQIAYVVQKHEEKMSKEELEWVEKYIPVERIKNRFNPRFADPIKSKFKTSNYDDNPTDFYKLYFNLLASYPDDYFSSFLNLNIPYWFTDAEAIDPYANVGYLETGIYDNYNYIFERNSKLPKLYEFYEGFASFETQKKHFILNKLYSLYLPIWLMLFMVFVAILKRQYKSILVILPLILLWMTYLLGPVSNFRYIIPIYLSYPIIIYLMLKKKNDANE